jgi:hypothetical protein
MLVALACDPSTSISRLGVFAFARNGMLAECCNCLASEEVYVADPMNACPEVDTDVADDGGCADGDSCAVPKIYTPCMCTYDANACRARLSRDLAVPVVGLCVDEGGPCESACGGVLAYPEPEE